VGDQVQQLGHFGLEIQGLFAHDGFCVQKEGGIAARP
jgi:hypothetical protein